MTIPDRSCFLLRSRFNLVCAVCFLLFGVGWNSVAAETHKPQRHAIIFGTVWGPDNRALPGIEVKIRPAKQKKAHWDLVSNRRGEFEAAVPAGPADYILWAITKHYKMPDGQHLQPSPEVTVHVDADERADTGLHLK